MSCWWECKFLQPLWRTVWRIIKNQKLELPYDSATPLLDIYSEKIIIQKDTWTPMFTAALFTIARTWKLPICLLTDEQIKKMWYIYTMRYYSVLKGIEIRSFVVMWVEVQSIAKSEVSWKEKSRYHILMHTYVI